MTKPADVARALAGPFADTNVLAAFGVFYLAIALMLRMIWGAPHLMILGLIMAAFLLPALCLFLMGMLEALVNGGRPGPLAVEHLHWFGSPWSLLQLVYLAMLVYASYLLGSLFGAAVLLLFLIGFAAVLPAALAILALTHSPVESLNPRAIRRLIGRCGAAYWIAPSFFLLAIVSLGWLGSTALPHWLVELAGLYLVFAFYMLIGSIVKPHELHREVEIHRPVEPDGRQTDASLARQRAAVLGHAYGFISRGNRAGGLAHIYDWLAADPQPDAAWPWFFEELLRWEKTDAALLFGQQWLGRLLEAGDDVAAVKLMLRCRIVSDAFMPLPADRPAAREAARRCGNEELLRVL